MPKKLQRIIRKYYKQLYANKLDNLDEMDKFLETYSLPKLNQKESENLNGQIAHDGIEEVIKQLPRNQSPGLDGFTGKFIANIPRRNNTYSSQTISKNSR